MPSQLFRSASLDRGSRRTTTRQRRERNLHPRLAIDQLESRIALAITTPLSIGGTTVASFFDAPTGPANLGDFVTVSIEGTKGTVIFNGGKGVADGTDIQTVEILDASPDFQLTFNATITTANPVPYASDGVIQLGQITTANVIRGINTVRGPLTNVAAPWEIDTSAIHLYTFNDGTVSGSTVSDLIGGADGTLVNGATVAGGSLVLAENPGPATGADVQYMSMPTGVLPQGSTAATFELWFTASNTTGVWGRGFDIGKDDQQYLMFTPLSGDGGSRAAITENSSAAERLVDGVTPYNDNTQHLATVTVDDAANTLTYYIDGVSLGSVTLDGTFLSGLEAINNFLGRSQYAQDPGFIGSMNQFAIYDRVLSSAEVAANYAAGPITAPLTPLGFTQPSPGSVFLVLEGDQTLVFPVGSFVCATPLLPATTPLGAPSFATVQTVAFDSITNKTTITVDNATAAGTTAGALTLAETIQPEFRLQSFVGVNFSNRTLKEGGGLFVDVVEGADVTYRGDTLTNVGILLSQGLLAYSTIGIRRELAANVLLGLSTNASTDGRMFVESATPESGIFLGPQKAPTALNSKFQLTGGAGPFGANLFSFQPFNGVVNLGSPATGVFLFDKGVGPQATLNAGGWNGVLAFGDFAGAINSTGDPLRLTVSRNVTGSARINAASDVSLLIAGSILKGAVVSSDQGTTFAVGGNVLGTIQAGSSEMSGAVGGNVSGAKIASSNDITLAVAGSILDSTIQADDEFTLDVARNVTNSTLSSGDSEVTFNVGGNVANSRFLGGLSGTVGGNATKSYFVAKGDDLDDEDPDVTLDIKGSMTSCHVEATSQVTVNVDGSVTKSKFVSTTSDVTVDVGVDIKDSTLISADDGVTLTVGRDALNTTVVGDDSDTELDIGRNFSGAVQNGSENLLVRVGGSVLKGSSFVTGDHALIDVGRNFDGSVTSQQLRFFVDGNVSKASRIVAQGVSDWQLTANESQANGSSNFGIGGRLDGIVNVVDFDAAPNYQTVTLVGGGVGASGRFYVERFDTDNLVFNGNFNGNMRVGQDLVANLNFGGNVDRITIAGRVGSYAPGNTITPVPVAINVAGRLRYLNSNSYFQAAVAGVNGTFYNDALGTQSTGILSTGAYTTVVPTLQVVPAPTPPAPQVYSAPSVPLGFSAAPIAPPTTTGGPAADFAPYAAIKVSFSAPASDGGLPVVYYEYTTNLLDPTPSWRRFDNPAQGPGTDIQLTCDSAGGAWINGNTYQVSVRAVNAIGPSTAPTAVPVTVTLPSG